MAGVQFAVWARVIALVATYFMILGGFVDIWWREPWYAVWIGIYSMLAGALLFPFLWPWKPLRCLVYPYQNYALAPLILLLISGPLFFVPPTCTAAGTLVLASIFYLLGLFRGEKGQSIEQLRQGQMRPNYGPRGD